SSRPVTCAPSRWPSPSRRSRMARSRSSGSRRPAPTRAPVAPGDAGSETGVGAGRPLEGRRVLLGVTGGIAAYKAAHLVRLLTMAGGEVQVVMTSSALRFVGADTFAA